ncbi:DUF6065 family protein [uncultured Mameliella sp.]|uniref:DUF6065 family protein n=1 Tax=uncultured Mameliella sp. TaxID=1447087 RepID=UPI00261BDBE7|nr:DUF6065 family protein [uncultured Mameliella sp.]
MAYSCPCNFEPQGGDKTENAENAPLDRQILPLSRFARTAASRIIEGEAEASRGPMNLAGTGEKPMSSTIRIHRLPGHTIRVEPAPVARRWMDKTANRFAYRCLPLNIANSHGWQVLCPSGFRVRMIGDDDRPKLEFEYDEPDTPPAVSHFGHGILTFHIGAVFETDPGHALYLTGPVNCPKQGIMPLSGIVETDWLPFTFTMNWRLMFRQAWIRFEKDEPFCMFFPVRLAEIEETRIEIGELADTPDLASRVSSFAESRKTFIEEQKTRPDDGSNWQKHYFRGRAPQGAAQTHYTSLKLASPVERKKAD